MSTGMPLRHTWSESDRVIAVFYTDPALTDSAKVGIIAGSVLAGCIGFLILRSGSPAVDLTTPARSEPGNEQPRQLVGAGHPAG